MGLSNSLKYLSKDHPKFSELQQALIGLFVAVRPYQEENQCWRWAIREPLAHIDTSGTAMIGYAIEVAVASKIIDRSWAAMSENALRAVLQRTHKNGIVDDSLADCMGVGHFANKFGPSNFAQGPTTALYALVLRRLSLEKKDSAP